MFDYLRDLTRSAEEKRQDALSAYLDGTLPAAEARRLEEELAEDAALRAQLADMRVWQQQLRALPSRRVPRNFTLDPALHGVPRRQPLGRAYPALRAATSLAAILFVIALAALFGGISAPVASEDVPVAMQAADEAEMPMAAEMAPSEAVADEASAATMAEEMAVAEEEAETLRAKPETPPRPLDDFVDPTDSAGGAVPPQEEQEVAPFAQVLPEAELAAEAQPETAEALPSAPVAEMAQVQDDGGAALANTLVTVTLILGGLLLLLLILTLLARRQR